MGFVSLDFGNDIKLLQNTLNFQGLYKCYGTKLHSSVGSCSLVNEILYLSDRSSHSHFMSLLWFYYGKAV